MSITSPETSIRPGQIIPVASGKKVTVILRFPQCILDSHSHIENGACVPLPLLYYQLPLQLHIKRKNINLLAKIIKNEAGRVQIKSTTEIGDILMSEADKTFDPDSDIGTSEHYCNSILFTFHIIQMMDMEYAGIMGFSGQTLYHEDTTWYYYERMNGKDPEHMGRKVELPGESQMSFSKWFWQLKETKEAIKKYPLQLIGMYHYDPRRWNFPKSVKTDTNYQKGAWSFPFDEIATIKQKGLFIGFKLYPPLGYKPLDKRLPYMFDGSIDGDCFYARCEREGIPILTHCSPGGMTTPDLEYYMEFDGEEPEPVIDDPMPKATFRKYFTPEGYFWTEYVHPRAWREVLIRFPNLKLCLAHFGGTEWRHGLESDWITEIIALTKEYPNVYTDIACWEIEKYKDAFSEILSMKRYAHLHEKILFGTDWYLTLVALDGKSYKEFCGEFWDFIMKLPDGKKIWKRFSFLNPFTFYGFDNPGVAGNIATKLEELQVDQKTLQNNLSSFRSLSQEYARLLKKR